MRINNVYTDFWYYVTDTDCIVVVDGPSDVEVNISLPSAVGIAGRVYTIKYVSTMWAKIYPDGGQTIDQYSDFGLDQWDYVTIVSDGSNWLITGRSP
jgi:hypothetical protein